MARILVVEDDPDNQDVISIMLQMGGHSVTVASNGDEALRKAQQIQPDLILMDLSMPQMDGWTATSTLKADPGLAHIPVIAVTAHALQGDDQKALDAGCTAYMSKPIDYTVLMNMVETHLPASASGKTAEKT